jgi:hypothetical protein
MNARDLSNRLAALLRTEQHAMADFLVALADYDRQKLWRELGHTSLFAFLHRELRLSRGAAHFRKIAAELIQGFPEVVEPLRDGRLCITSVVELAKVITPENRSLVMPRFFHCSKREAKEVAAELRPAEAAPHRTVVTTVTIRRAPAAAPTVASEHAAFSSEPVRPDEPQALAVPPDPSTARSSPQSTRAPVPPDEPAPVSTPALAGADEHQLLVETNGRQRPSRDEHCEPLTADLRRLHITVSRRFLAKLDAARAALSHSHPGGSSEEVLEAALDLLLAANARKKGLVDRPAAKPRPNARPGHFPAAVKREVWKRAGGKCEWRHDSGEVCGSTLRLEFDHAVARALGGPSTIENVRLACAAHNQLAARRAFGDAWMDRFVRKRSGQERAPSPSAEGNPARLE